MVVDTSALLAIVFGEPDAESHLETLLEAPGVLHVSAMTLVEAVIVAEARQGPDATRDLDLLLDGLGVEIAEISHEQARHAIAAWRRFGKGRHPAGLNLGDCFSYALAKDLVEPLLFKGDDFGQTDITGVHRAARHRSQ